MPRNAHFWQVGLLEVILSEYLDKSHNFTNLIFMISSLQDSFPLPFRFSAMPVPMPLSGSIPFRTFDSCRSTYHSSHYKSFDSLFFPITVFLPFDFRGVGGESRPVLDIHCTKCQTLFSCTHNKLNNT